MKVSFLLPLILCLGLHQVYGTEKVKWLSSCSRRSDETLLKLHSWRSGNLENLKESYEIIQIRKRHTVFKKPKWREECSTMFWKHFHFMPSTPTMKCCHTSSHPVFLRIGLPQYVPCHWIQSPNLRQSLDSFNSLCKAQALYQSGFEDMETLVDIEDAEDLLSCWNWVEKTQTSWNLWVCLVWLHNRKRFSLLFGEVSARRITCEIWAFFLVIKSSCGRGRALDSEISQNQTPWLFTAEPSEVGWVWGWCPCGPDQSAQSLGRFGRLGGWGWLPCSTSANDHFHDSSERLPSCMSLGEYPHSLFGDCQDLNGKLLKEVIFLRQGTTHDVQWKKHDFCLSRCNSQWEVAWLKIKKDEPTVSDFIWIFDQWQQCGMRWTQTFGNLEPFFRQGAVQLSWTHLKEIGTPIVGEYFCKCPGRNGSEWNWGMRGTSLGKGTLQLI